MLLALAWGQLRGSGLSASRNQALIVGLNDSGKTSLFTILRYGKLSATQSSMEENSGSFRLHDRWLCIVYRRRAAKVQDFQFIDIPGHDKLRFKLLDYLPKARGVIFLVDASTFQKKIRSAAELLADILGERSVAKDEIPIVVVVISRRLLAVQDRLKLFRA
ncbi:signal recognition particle receptor beta subunit-domain-containing protein [Chytridium lagenaria]|nr:signal recognition particle receptor beta subunit-domain-containing protein [Chytridium lagenaria]